VALEAVTQDGDALQYASWNLKADKEVVLAAVTQEGEALEFASEDLKADKEVALEAVTQESFALQYASVDLKADKEVVLAAVTQDGEALQFASEDLNADKEVMLVAVRQDGYALQYASEDLKADKEVVLEAVAQIGTSLCFVSEALREGGLRAYMDGLAFAHRSLLFFLFAAMPPLDALEVPEGPAPPHAHTVHAQCITKLSSDSKRLIADFLGAPVGKGLRTLNVAFWNLNQRALSSSLFDFDRNKRMRNRALQRHNK
jgi:uncharacterized lipoprotein YbaY